MWKSLSAASVFLLLSSPFAKPLSDMDFLLLLSPLSSFPFSSLRKRDFSV